MIVSANLNIHFLVYVVNALCFCISFVYFSVHIGTQMTLKPFYYFFDSEPVTPIFYVQLSIG